MTKLELLAPAKNLDYGREAINHGVDAVYIGAPAFGARQAATNTVEDIEELVRYAHLYGSKVFATVNTLLFDDELEAAVRMIHRLYNVGVDALIVQDMGLLECDLPPIELHASTQCHNATVERVQFMEQVGFRRVILARETSLEQMRTVRQATTVALEAFVHGALCVSYSGQCYMSQYLNGRSGNRGCCSQPCRSRYDLYNGDGDLLLKDKYLLSLKDFSAAAHMKDLVEAGITSFKIEGRLKDVTYVKNVTAYYRQLIDSMYTDARSSSGKSVFYFTSDIDRTFNRGYTDYFLAGRHPMASFDTQKSVGKRVGRVAGIANNRLIVNADSPLMAGDGLCYYDAKGNLQGFLINQVQGNAIVPNRATDVTVGTQLWRNHDQAFEKQLQGKSAERKVAVRIRFYATGNGFGISMVDEDGIEVEASMAVPHEEAHDRQRAADMVQKQLAKLGDSPFRSAGILDETEGRYHLSAAMLNGLRREAVEQLKEHRIKSFRPQDTIRTEKGTARDGMAVDYRANVVNSRAEEFYKQHGINVVERGLEQTGRYEGKALMTTKYCLRYELGCCLRGKGGWNAAQAVKISPDDSLMLRNNDRWFRLRFDCARCQMEIMASRPVG